MGRSIRTRNILFVAAALSAVFIVVLAIGIAGWEYTNSDHFCAVICHDVHPEEPYAHQASQHARVACVECHMGRLPTFKMMAVKATHVGEIWGMITGYERPLTAPRIPASRRACEGCHSEQPHQYDSIRVRKHYAPDEANTETTIRLVLRTAGGAAREGEGLGIHWHTANQVRFIAADPKKQNIPWLEVTRADGSTVTYADMTQPIKESEIEESEKRIMDCVDCHNRIGHPFLNPERVLDDALAEGRLSRRFPYVKARLIELLQQDFTTEEEALRRVEEAWDRYLLDFPNIATDYPDEIAKSRRYMRERQKFVANLMARSKFREPGVSWRSFPNTTGHFYSPGCFRCHSGKHVNAEGQPIRVNCTLCHEIPVIVSEGKPEPKVLPSPGLSSPDFHRAPDFMANHMVLAMEDEEGCQGCHGEISFGEDNTSFCSNLACHGITWPNLTLDSN